jgi:PAS domain S-box-containing protein
MTGEKRRSDDQEPRSKADLVRDLVALEAHSDASTAQLLRELQTHQIELEMQNHALREAQQQLEETRDRYADLYDFAPVGYLTLDESARILEINLNGTAILGHMRAALIGTPLTVRFVPGCIQLFLDHLREVFRSSGNVMAELKIKQPNGKQRYVRLESRVVSDVGAQAPTCRTVMLDTTEQHVISEVLQQVRSEQRVLLSTIPASVCYKDLSLRYTAASQVCAEFFGLTVRELIGKTDFALFPAEQARELQRIDRSVLESGTALTNLEKPFSDKSGTLRWFNVSVAPYFGPDQKVAGLIEVSVDITAIHAAEQRTRELLTENRQLARRMFTLQEAERRYVAQELHDELGQWLTAIAADAEAISHAAPAQTAIGEGARAIRESATRVHEVIRRITHHLRPELLAELGLAESLRELVTQWQKCHTGVACKLTYKDFCSERIEEHNLTVYRIVQETLTNIARHAKAKHISIVLTCTGLNPVLDQVAEADKPLLLLAIEDDGKGMDLDIIPKGIGLLGMRERAIAGGGEFFLRSAIGQGVHIEVRLPLVVLKEESNGFLKQDRG